VTTTRWSGAAGPATGAVASPHSPEVDGLAGTLTARLCSHLRQPLYANVYALTLNTVVSSLLGIGYWILAARLYSPREVGAGTAVVSTMTFLSSLSQLNLNGALARFLPAAGSLGGRLIAGAYLASSTAALVLGAGFLLVASVVSRPVGALSGNPALALVFVLSVAAWSVFTLQDSVLTALRGAVWVPLENAGFGLAKVALLVLLASAVPHLGVFLSWNLPVVVALVLVNLLVFRRLLPRLRLRPTAELPGRRALLRFVTLDYVGYLFMQAGTNALPLLVTAVLGAGATAVFYVGWLLGGSLELVAYHFGTSLTVESSADRSRLAPNARQVLRRGVLLFVPAAALLAGAAPLLLALFGSEYVHGSATVVRLFAVAVVPKLVVVVFVAASRVQRRIGRIVLVQAGTTAVVVSLAMLSMPVLGVVGVGVAYLTGQVLAASAVAPTLVRLLRSAT
jgi:O-antigen/teichoic acid export membrane protein